MHETNFDSVNIFTYMQKMTPLRVCNVLCLKRPWVWTNFWQRFLTRFSFSCLLARCVGFSLGIAFSSNCDRFLIDFGIILIIVCFFRILLILPWPSQSQVKPKLALATPDLGLTWFWLGQARRKSIPNVHICKIIILQFCFVSIDWIFRHLLNH